jgi:uncharacterized SAM-binding protein YcdF (DUF218 family)
MLSLSFIWIIALLGLPLIWQFYRVYNVASTSCSPKQTVDTWIIFGKKLQNNQLDSEYKRRITATYQALKNHHPRTLIFQGGITHNNTVSEAQAGLEYFNSLFIEPYSHQKTKLRFLLEEKSKNTLENLINTREYLQREQRPLKVTLISNRYHLLRCSVIAQNMGFSTELLPAESEWKFNLIQACKIILEAFFLNWYSTGKFVSTVLNNKRMLNKIQ